MALATMAMLVVVAVAGTGGAGGTEPKHYAAVDTLSATPDPKADAQQCLASLTWPATRFSVECRANPDLHNRAIVRFASPVSTGDANNDRVAMDWYQVHRDGKPVDAPAVVVVHESGSGMVVGRAFALALQIRGVHAFLIHLPHYGLRRSVQSNAAKRANLVPLVKQAIADVRRARDAVAVLPYIQPDRIGVQGTSLGGFVVAPAASLDGKYYRVFIMLAGGDLHAVVTTGQRDAAKAQQQFAEAGYTGEKLRDLLYQVEPLRLAHRLPARRTWLFSATDDTVVPPKCSELLAQVAALPEGHHQTLAADHYTGIIYLPRIIDHMVAKLNEP